MANFSPIKDQIIPIEGGYVFNKNDPGGETKYGISKRSYPHLDIKNLTLDEAGDIYKRDFWDVIKLDQFNDQSIAENIFWFGVHAGPITSIKCLQKALNKIGQPVISDGIIGKETLNSVNSVINPIFKLDALKLEQIQYYVKIVNSKPSSKEFLLGWINRIFKI